MGSASSMLGILNMTPILTGECCPHAARALVTTIVQVVPMILVLLLVISYPIVTANYGVLFLLPMLVLSATLAALLFKYLPETKGLPVRFISATKEVCQIIIFMSFVSSIILVLKNYCGSRHFKGLKLSLLMEAH